MIGNLTNIAIELDVSINSKSIFCDGTPESPLGKGSNYTTELESQIVENIFSS